MRIRFLILEYTVQPHFRIVSYFSGPTQEFFIKLDRPLLLRKMIFPLGSLRGRLFMGAHW